MVSTTRSNATELNARLVQKIEVSPSLAIMRFVPEGWELPDFKPGQFAVIGVPATAPRCHIAEEPDDVPDDPNKLIKRAYSIASSSVNKEYLEVYVALVPSGHLTPRLFALEVGEQIWLGSKISGMFTLDQVPEGNNVVMVSTGTGLAPYMSMIRTHLECGSDQHFAILHGARHSWELGYRSELLMVGRMCQNFTYIPTLSRPQGEPLPWTGESGYVQDLWKKRPLSDRWPEPITPDNTHIFLCGNPAMTQGMTFEVALFCS